MGALSPRGVIAQTVCEAPWTLTETARIGSVDGDDALGPILDVAVGPRGLLYVAQSFVPAVSVFTPMGRFVRTIGRAGQGPGEFDVSAIRVGWKADTLWVTDTRSVHLFGPDDRVLRQLRFSARVPDEGSRLLPVVPLPDGTVLPRRVLSGDIPRYFRAERLAVRRLSESGAVLDTIAVLRQRLHVDLVENGYVLHPLEDGFGSALPYAVTPDGSAIVTVGGAQRSRAGASFQLVKISVTGDTLLDRAIPYEPRRVSRSDRAWLTEAFGNLIAGDYDSGPHTMRPAEATKERRRRDAREAITFPDYHPPVRQIVAGHDGSIWLLRELDLPDRVDRWEVYGSAGDLEGYVEVSEGMANSVPWFPRLELHHVSRDEVWGSTVDDLDVPYLRRYSVSRSCR